jgi:hypothetical protein
MHVGGGLDVVREDLAHLEQLARIVLKAKAREATCEPDETSEPPTDRKQRDGMRAIRGTLLSSFS